MSLRQQSPSGRGVVKALRDTPGFVARRGAGMTGTVYQLRVVLAVTTGISPMVWCRLLVPSEISVAGLREILRVAFGWSDECVHRVHDPRGHVRAGAQRPRQ
jgi:hypothetical protein